MEVVTAFDIVLTVMFERVIELRAELNFGIDAAVDLRAARCLSMVSWGEYDRRFFQEECV